MKATFKKIAICMLIFAVTFSTSNISAQAASKKSYTANDLKYLTSIVYCEAGNQSYKGKLAVANVVLNRVSSKKFPNTIKAVIQQKGQFSPYRSGSLAKALKIYDGGKASSAVKKQMSACKKAAKDALNGKRAIGKSYLFFSGYRTKSATKKKYSNAIFIGAHYFR